MPRTCHLPYGLTIHIDGSPVLTDLVAGILRPLLCAPANPVLTDGHPHVQYTVLLADDVTQVSIPDPPSVAYHGQFYLRGQFWRWRNQAAQMTHLVYYLDDRHSAGAYTNISIDGKSAQTTVWGPPLHIPLLLKRWVFPDVVRRLIPLCGMWSIHAAGLSLSNKGILFLGVPQTGKSTVCLACMTDDLSPSPAQREHALVGDDEIVLALANTSDGLVTMLPMPRDLVMRASGFDRFEAPVRQRLQGLPWVHHADGYCTLALHQLTASQHSVSPVPIRALVFLQNSENRHEIAEPVAQDQASGDPQPVPLSVAQALARALQITLVNAPRVPSDREKFLFAAIQRIVQTAPAFTLKLAADPLQAAAALYDLADNLT